MRRRVRSRGAGAAAPGGLRAREGLQARKARGGGAKSRQQHLRRLSVLWGKQERAGTRQSGQADGYDAAVQQCQSGGAVLLAKSRPPHPTRSVRSGDAQLINNVYLDNSSLELYHARLDKRPGAMALRVRWAGPGEPDQASRGGSLADPWGAHCMVPRRLGAVAGRLRWARPGESRAGQSQWPCWGQSLGHTESRHPQAGAPGRAQGRRQSLTLPSRLPSRCRLPWSGRPTARPGRARRASATRCR